MPSTHHKIRGIFLILLTLLGGLPTHAQTVTKLLGSNGTDIADVVPGNTSPGASKKALVVTISPNSPSPAGSQDVNLIKVGGAAVTLGQKTSTASVPMVIASDQSAIPVSGSLTPSGTQNVNLTQVGGAAVALGQALMASSFPVAIASNQSAIAITVASLPLPAGAATEATLSTLNGKFGTLGQKTSAGSAPVVIASDQSSIPVVVTPSGTQDVNLTKVGGSAVALGQAAMATSIPVAIASNQSTLNVQGTADDNSTNSAVKLPTLPARANTAAPTWTNGNQVPLSEDLSGNLRTLATQNGTWTVNLGTTNGGAGQLALDATVSGLQVSQGSTTSGQKGGLTLGAVTTAAPTYTTAQSSPLSLTTAGALRVDASATTQPVSGAVTANQGGAPWSQNLTQVGGAAVALGQATNTASFPVTISSTQTGTAGSAAAQVLTVQGIASMTPVQVSQATASNLNAQVVGNVAAGSAISGNPVTVAGSDGVNVQRLAVDASGRQKVAGASSFAYITSATTTAVKAGAGILRSVNITATSTGGSLTVYDANNATTTPIAGFTVGTAISFPLNLAVTNGITVVTAAGFNGQVTIVYD